MRRRLVFSTLAAALICVLLLGIPLGVVASRLIHDEAQQRLNRQAQKIAADVDALRATDRPAQARDGFDDVVTISASDKQTTNRIVTAWLVVGGLGIVALGVAVALAGLQAKRFGGPFEELVVAAERLGSGDLSPHARRHPIPEMDKLAHVLDRSAQRVDQLLRAERAVAANASHQLRTPLTALSIRIEEIMATADSATVKAEATAALAACERLTDVIDSLLADHTKSSQPRHIELVDLDGVVEQQREEWEPVFRRADRGLTVGGDRGLKASGNHGNIAQTLATLIENALVHGDGAVRLALRNAGGQVVIDVSDEGAGVADELLPRIFERSFSSSSSTGLGLSLARDLIEADGGRLQLTQARPPIFSVFLIAAP